MVAQAAAFWRSRAAWPTLALWTDLLIDDATLNAAEQLFAVRYTDSELAICCDNLAEQIELAVRRRAVKLANALPPATLFDPRLPGFTMPPQPAPNIPRAAPALPVADEDIAFAPVRSPVRMDRRRPARFDAAHADLS